MQHGFLISSLRFSFSDLLTCVSLLLFLFGSVRVSAFEPSTTTTVAAVSAPAAGDANICMHEYEQACPFPPSYCTLQAAHSLQQSDQIVHN